MALVEKTGLSSLTKLIGRVCYVLYDYYPLTLRVALRFNIYKAAEKLQTG
jgi:hypothetical protein